MVTQKNSFTQEKRNTKEDARKEKSVEKEMPSGEQVKGWPAVSLSSKCLESSGWDAESIGRTVCLKVNRPGGTQPNAHWVCSLSSLGTLGMCKALVKGTDGQISRCLQVGKTDAGTISVSQS